LDKLIEGESLSEKSSDSEYVPKTKLHLKSFKAIASSIQKQKVKGN